MRTEVFFLFFVRAKGVLEMNMEIRPQLVSESVRNICIIFSPNHTTTASPGVFVVEKAGVFTSTGN